MLDFGIKDAIDILLFAVLLYYIYRLMKESGTINIFYGVLAFIVVWVLASEIFDMRLIGTILDKFMAIGLIILVILFQEPIKRFLVELGSQRRWRFLSKLFHHHKEEIDNEALAWVMPIVYACMSMSKSKTGALIVVEQSVPLDNYSASGDRIDALINNGEATVKVLDTDSKWFGVTYAADRPGVVEKFAELHREGVYPSPLFKKA